MIACGLPKLIILWKKHYVHYERCDTPGTGDLLASNVWLLVATNTFYVSLFTQFHTTQWALAAPFMQTTISCSNLLATRAIAQRFLVQHCIWLVTNFTLQLPGTTHSGDRQYLFFHLFIYFPSRWRFPGSAWWGIKAEFISKTRTKLNWWDQWWWSRNKATKRKAGSKNRTLEQTKLQYKSVREQRFSCRPSPS